MPDEQGALVAEPGEGALNWPALGALREGLDPRDATDALYALGGTDLYRSLVRERGWTPDR